MTVKSIASHAGVSIGAVSSVLNNRHVERRISPETVEKIRAAASKLGYLPNLGARRLRSNGGARNSVVVGLVTSFEAPIPLINHFISALREAMRAGRRLSFSMMIEMFPSGRIRELPGLLTGDHFNAAIILNTTADDDQFLSRTHLPYPTVLVNRRIAGYASVLEDAKSGARSAEILSRAGRQNFAVLHGSPLTQSTSARVSSFMQRSFELLGRPAAEVVANSLSEAAGHEGMRAFLQRRPKVDALYAVSDALALGAYRAVKEAGLRIPQDIAVVGVGDYQIAPYFDPPLSCVGASHQRLAEQASRLLLKRLERGAQPPECVYVPVVETLRDSSGH